ncbi:unnamed protein product, partial [Rotaria sp. Silwood2]
FINIFIENKYLSNQLFIFISKSLSYISHSCKKFLLLNEYINKDNLIKLILNTEQIWLIYRFNYFLIDFIYNNIYLPNEIYINNYDKQFNDEHKKKKHFPPFQKIKKKI